MRIGTNKGHTLSGKGIGATGCGKKEERLTREVGKYLDEILNKEGHTAVDITVDSATSQGAALTAIVQKANGAKIELFISIHFNASDGSGNGVEVWIYDYKDITNPIANRICKNFENLGYKNRGVKLSKNAPQGGLSVVDNTNMPAMLIECCFIDNKNDMSKYNSYNFAKAIAEGILNKTIDESEEDTKPVEIKYAVLINSYEDIIKARSVSHMLKHDDNLHSEVVDYNGKYAVKIYPLSPLSKAEGIKKLVREKYDAYSDIIKL